MHVLAALLPSKCTAVHANYMVVDAVQEDEDGTKRQPRRTKVLRY